MIVMEGLRQSGRTTRMLKAVADALKDQSKKVYVVFFNTCEINSAIDSVKKLGFFDEVKDSVFITLKNAEAVGIIDAKTLREMKPEETLVFIDHGVIEVEFARYVTMLHQYDESLHFGSSSVVEMKYSQDPNVHRSFSLRLRN